MRDIWLCAPFQFHFFIFRHIPNTRVRYETEFLPSYTHSVDAAQGLPQVFLDKPNPTCTGGSLMNFYAGRHKFYCGIDLHARKMHLCLLDEGGTICRLCRAEAVFDR
jgi:hypothetical protein